MNLGNSLFRKYLLVLLTVVCSTLLAASAAQAILGARAQWDSADALLRAESRSAGVRIRSFLSIIETSMTWVLDYDQPGARVDLDQIRDESHRLLRKLPSISALRYVDGTGCMRLSVARVGADRVSDCATPHPPSDDAALLAAAHAHGVAYGPVRFRDASIPSIDLAVVARGRHGGVLLAEVDLRQIHATIIGIRVGAAGYAYIVDRQWHLVAHPDNSLVLRNLGLGSLPLVTGGAAENGGRTVLGRDLAGALVLASSTMVTGPDWYVFVQLPAAQAFSPLIAQLVLGLVIFVVAVVAATTASRRLARRMVQPILAVQAGAGRMAGGDLATRIHVNTGDEVELLAHEFNHMAEALSESYALLEDKVRLRTLELELTGSQVRHQADQLAALNAELSLRLAELSLRRDEAERASAAKTRFLAAASHDLLQPLHAVGLLVGILRQRIRYPEVRDLVLKVVATVRGMESLFGSLLDVSKLDSNAVKVDLQVVDLRPLLEFIDLNFQPLAVEKGIRLRVAPCRCIVRTDPALLERIVANLVSNAIRYTESGTVLVGCRRAGDSVRLLVYDTGIGIAQQHQAQIFEEFYQVEESTRPRDKGLGLGLAIVRRTVDLLGLTLHMRSQPGAGSIFGISLPRHRHGGLALDSPGNPAAHHEQLRGAFIAVMEDDTDAREALEQLLLAAGCHVVAGASLDAVRALLGGHLRTPDLIVTDLRLGHGASGIDAIAAIRTLCDGPVPALILTGDARPPAPSALPAHCQLLRKPVGPSRLFEACAGLVSAPARDETPSPAFPPR